MNMSLSCKNAKDGPLVGCGHHDLSHAFAGITTSDLRLKSVAIRADNAFT